MLNEKRNQLINKLIEIIYNVAHDKSIKQEVGNEFIRRNLDARRATQAMQLGYDLRTLSDSEDDTRFLFLFTYALNKALGTKYEYEVKVEDYFTQAEYNRWINYSVEKREESPLPLIIPNCQQVTEKMYQTVLSIQEVVRWRRQNILYYNFNTQRNPIITAYGERINVDAQKVQEIKERIKQGIQYPDPIIINILNNGESSYTYNEKTREIVVHEGSILNPVDGWHRLIASDEALDENPDINFNWQVTITFLTEKAAHDYMAQKDKQKPMKREWIEAKDYTKPENLVIDSIIDDKLSELGKVMKDDDKYIQLNMALTKKSIVATAIKENYGDKLDTSINIRNIARWIVEFTDYLMGYYVDEFINNPYQVKETSYINDKNMFAGYIALSAVLYGDKEWKQKLKDKIQSIDFSKDNPIWREIGLHVKGDMNKATRNKLYKFMKEGV